MNSKSMTPAEQKVLDAARYYVRCHRIWLTEMEHLDRTPENLPYFYMLRTRADLAQKELEKAAYALLEAAPEKEAPDGNS